METSIASPPVGHVDDNDDHDGYHDRDDGGTAAGARRVDDDYDNDIDIDDDIVFVVVRS
jgi:hypothetical protein